MGFVFEDARGRIEGVIRKPGGVVVWGRLDLVDDPPADVDVAAGDGLEACDHPQQRGLAAAGGADQHAELAVADLEVDALDGLEAAGVGLADVAEGDISHETLSAPFALAGEGRGGGQPARWIPYP